MPRKTVWTLFMLILGTAAAGAGAEPKLTYQDVLSYLTDLDRLPVIEPGVYCKQFSSYDRQSRLDQATGEQINWDANGDAGKYLRIDPETKEGVMAEMEGPGCIFRIWSANPQGVIRFYLDGDTKPTYEWDFNALFRGKTPPFISPLVWCREPNNFESAADCYLPIPYAKSCKVTSLLIDKKGKPMPPGHYYHIDYRTFPKAWQVETFKLPLSTADAKAVEETAHRWSGGGALADFKTTQLTVGPGATVVAAELKGPGIIRALRAKLHRKEKWATRKVLLKGYWDGEEKPSIDAPIGDFFGEPKDAPYRSYPMEIDDHINSCYFPMPIQKSARIVFVNEGKMPATVSFSAEFQERQVPDNWALFHAKYRQEQESTTFDYPLIETTGTGKFVGVCLFPDNIHGGWWGEGDEKVWVDGEKFPSWFGTGSEDYFGDAWGIRYFTNPSHGHPQKGVERMQGCYRWHIADNIPFYKSFRMTIENYAGLPSEKTKNDYYSVAYWYQLPGGSDAFGEVSVAARIPRGHVAPDALEAEDHMSGQKDGSAIVDDDQLPHELSRGRGVKLTGKSGDTFTFNLPVDHDERYRITAGTADGVKAGGFELLVDGKKVGRFAELHKGRSEVTVRLLDEQGLILDYFRLDVYRNFITDWLIIGPFASPDDKGLDVEYPPEQDLDFKARYRGLEGKEIGWHKFSQPNGKVFLTGALTPNEHCVAYGACVVTAPADGRYTLLLGSDDGVKVWLNRKEVWKNPAERSLVPDSDKVEVSLNKGPNLLLLKVQQGSGDVGWAVRFQDLQDRLEYSLPQ